MTAIKSSCARLLALVAALATAPPVVGIERLAIQAGRASGAGWSSGPLTIELSLADPDRATAAVRAEGLDLPEPLHTLRTVAAGCPSAGAGADAIRCERGRLLLRDAQGREQVLPLATALVRVREGWRLRAETAAVEAAPLWAFAAAQGWVPALEIGAGTFTAVARLEEEARTMAGFRVRVDGLAFSDAAGLNAGEGLGGRVEGSLHESDRGWRVGGTLALERGQIYLDPVFADAGATPMVATAEGTVQDAGGVRISRWHFHHEGVATLEGSLTLDAGGDLVDLSLDLPRTPAASLYEHYLQPFAIGTALDALSIAGTVDGEVRWRSGSTGSDARLGLRSVQVADAAGHFDLSGITGGIHWSDGSDGTGSRVTWESGRLYRIDFGAGGLEGVFADRRFALDRPMRVPLLEGAVVVDDLVVDDIGTDMLAWRFRGAVEPLSMVALTGALGWPTFAGTLAGDVPSVRFTEGVMSVDGSLDVKVFGGRVAIRNLGITDPFGIVPVLAADVDVYDFSLDALTSTFSFGNIEGRLEGRVHGLILKDWKPTAFDARFATPDDDDSRHRISQRAVENLASIGGAGAVLSTTFLRIFDEFSYSRLGIACRLERGVCEMDGVAPAQQGYYIVEGGGLPPRIDVLGFNRRVDWGVLLGRLEQIVASEGPVVR